jgi:hypothetical protein
MSHDENAFRTQSFHVSQKGSLANLFENSNNGSYQVLWFKKSGLGTLRQKGDLLNCRRYPDPSNGIQDSPRDGECTVNNLKSCGKINGRAFHTPFCTPEWNPRGFQKYWTLESIQI